MQGLSGFRDGALLQLEQSNEYGQVAGAHSALNYLPCKLGTALQVGLSC